MVCILLNMALGINTTHIPYRGTGPALAGSGRRPARLPVRAGADRAAADPGQRRQAASRCWPASAPKSCRDIPTAQEQGLKDFEVLSWNALFLPKGTPEPIVRRLNAAMSQALDTPWVRERLEKLGLEVPEPAQRTPEYLATFLESEIKKWAAPIKASGVSVE